MDDVKIVDRIAKLLALAESPNEFEAAAGAAKAQALMLEYKIEMHKVERATVGIRASMTETGVLTTTKVPAWKSFLLVHVARTSFCSVYIKRTISSYKSNGTRIYESQATLVGRKSDVEVASCVAPMSQLVRFIFAAPRTPPVRTVRMFNSARRVNSRSR